MTTLILAAACMTTRIQDLSDPHILNLGYERWIERHRGNPDNYDILNGAERRFALALGMDKERRIQSSPLRDTLQTLDLELANVTKGASRVSDFQFDGTGRELLMGSKATTSMVLTMDAVLRRTPCQDAITEADVRRIHQEVLRAQSQFQDKIRAYARRGGYSTEQHQVSFEALEKHFERSVRTTADLPPDAKRHVFVHYRRMFRMALGIDPLPYPNPE